MPARATLLLLAVAAICCAGPTASVSARGWEPLGEPGSGGRISALAVSPYDPDRVLVGGDMLGVGLSTDGGASWQTTTGFASWEIGEFTWHPTDPSVVWVGTMSGPYRSDDGGQTWVAKRSGLPQGDSAYSAPVEKVAIDPADPLHLLAFSGNQREFKAGGTGALNYGRVYESHDGGEWWDPISTVGLNANILSVAYGASDLRTIYVAVKDAGVLRSVDGGHQWEPANNGLPAAAVHGLAIDPDHPDHLWAALTRGGGIYATVDGGATWTSANPASLTSSMYSVYRADDGTLYTADQGYRSLNRFKSTDGGGTWQSISGSFAKFYPASSAPYVWAASARGDRVFAGTSDTLMASSDRGGTWRDVGATKTGSATWRGTGFSGLLGTRAAFSARRPGLALLTAFDAGNMLRSEDAGASWSRPASSWDAYGGAYDVAIGGLTGTIAYSVLGQAGEFNGILVSTNAGKSWTGHAGGSLPTRRSSGRSRGAVAVGSANGSLAYAVLPDGVVYRTADTGRTWSRAFSASPASSVAVSRDFATVYVGAADGVYIKRRGGTFAREAGSPTQLRRLVVDRNGTVYGTGELGGNSTTSGAWRRTSGHWNRILANKWASDVAVDSTDTRLVAVTTNDNPYHDSSFATGVWISRDAGSSFTQFNEGLAMTRVLSAAFDPSRPGRLVIGTNGRGFWQANIR